MTDQSAQHKIVVGVDGSDASKSALRWALGEASAHGSTVLVVNVWQFPMVAFGDYHGTTVPMVETSDLKDLAERTLRDAVDEIVGDDRTVEVGSEVRTGHPAQELMEASKDADLLVVGSVGHGGFSGMLLGSVSNHLVHHATTPLVVVRPGWTASHAR